MSSPRDRMLSSHEVRQPLLRNVILSTRNRDGCNEKRRQQVMAIEMERATSLPECNRKSTSPNDTGRHSTRSRPKAIVRSEDDIQRQGMPSDYRSHHDGFRLEPMRTNSLTVNSRMSPRYRPLVLDPTALEEPVCFGGGGRANDDGVIGVSSDLLRKPDTQRLLRQSQTEVGDDSDDEIHVRSEASISSDSRRYKALSTSEPLETTQPETSVKDDAVETPMPEMATAAVPAKRRDVPKSLFDRRRNFAKLYRYASGPEIVVHSVNDDDDRTPMDETGVKGALGGPRARDRHGASYPRFPFARCDTAPVDTDDYYSGGRMCAGRGMMASNLTAAVSPSMQSTTSFLRDHISSIFQVSDNKLAMKLFGNKNALVKEKQRQQAVGKWVIHPCSNFRFYWDLCMLILLIANLIILPVGISFFNDDLSTGWIVFNTISDTIFLIDLAINFRTGIIADNFADEIILDPKEIAKHYVRTWFLLDLVSSLPLDYVITMLSPEENVPQLVHAGRALRMFRLVKLLSLLRLLRLSRLVRYVSQWEEFVTSAAAKFIRFFNLVSLILLLAHWNGCLQFLVPMLQEFPRDSWVILEELQDADWSEQYTWSLFKALSHMLSIGYGRYPPQSITDVWLTMVSMLTGATCYALFVGHSTTIIQSFDTSRRLYNDKFKQVEEYMVSRKLPRPLRQKITEYYEHRYHGKMFEEHNILAELNECLREEVVSFNCRALVASVPFFTSASPEFVTEVVSHLHFEVYQPGDIIVRAGTIGERMYFLQEGIVSVLSERGELVTNLSEGSYFGEISLMCKRGRRVATVRAESYCNVFTLSAEHFTAILEHHPDMKSTMEYVARERLQNLAAASSPSNVTVSQAAATTTANNDITAKETVPMETGYKSIDGTVLDTDVEILSPDEYDRTAYR